MPTLKPILNVSQLSIWRGKKHILEAVDWTVRAGEHWVILGANGSGKTSLLSILTGYLTASRGAIHVLGRTFGEDDWQDLRLEIGLVGSAIRQMVPEDEPALLTVIGGKYAMIDYWGRVKKSDKFEAAAILERVECSELADRPWGYLSQGERQRVFIGRALMAHPKLLILDEPCAGLDPAAREQFLDFLQRIARQPDPPTLVLVTHHVEEILPLFTHVLGLRDGKVLGAGPLRPTLTSKFLEQIFRAPCRLSRRSGRYQLAIRTRKDRVA